MGCLAAFWRTAPLRLPTHSSGPRTARTATTKMRVLVMKPAIAQNEFSSARTRAETRPRPVQVWASHETLGRGLPRQCLPRILPLHRVRTLLPPFPRPLFLSPLAAP